MMTTGLSTSQVRDFAIFHNIDDADLRAVLQSAKTRRVAKRAVVFEQGQSATEFFVLMHGHLKVAQTTPEGRQIIVRIVEPGELFGVAVALGRSDYPATATAMEECIILAWPSSTWSSLVTRAPLLAVNALHTIGQRVEEAHTRLREVSTEDVERRVAHLLLRIVGAKGSKTGDAADLGFPITRHEIAEMTGTTIYTVSRVLSAWEKEGLVAGGRERIAVTDLAKLRKIAAGAAK
jgi:CRP-like cAMP-binding protein